MAHKQRKVQKSIIVRCSKPYFHAKTAQMQLNLLQLAFFTGIHFSCMSELHCQFHQKTPHTCSPLAHTHYHIKPHFILSIRGPQRITLVISWSCIHLLNTKMNPLEMIAKLSRFQLCCVQISTYWLTSLLLLNSGNYCLNPYSKSSCAWFAFTIM